MKKPITLLMCLVILLLMSACNNMPSETTTIEMSTEVTTSTAAESIATNSITATSETPTESAESTTPDHTTNATAESTTTEATTSTVATTTTSTTTVRMYSSYAHMVSYDPARGFADFDYFNMLKGQEAIDYLVEREGYERADAEALVNDFADSEFIEQNDNPLLRTIDLREIDLKLMYHPDGTMVTGATPIDSDLIDLYNLYHVDPDLVLDSFFYYVHVSGGIVTMVEQVYWP